MCIQMRTHLVSISEASRLIGHDRRTIAKIAHLADIKVMTRTGALYDLAELRHVLMVHAPHLRRPTRTDSATRMINLN
jgi:hypothetical protein